jgi:hypothetical protein
VLVLSLSYLVLCRVALWLPCLMLSCRALLCFVLSCLVLCRVVLACLVLSCGCLVLSCSCLVVVLSCLVLSCLSCLVLSCLCVVLSCLVSPSPDVNADVDSAFVMEPSQNHSADRVVFCKKEVRFFNLMQEASQEAFLVEEMVLS